MRRRAAGGLLIGLLISGCGTTAQSAAASERTRVPTPSPTAEPTPFATEVAGLQATVLPLGSDAAPIDVMEAMGSVWVALHHGNAVARLDPATGEEIARIPTGFLSGPGWFTVGDGSIWVTNQNGTGVSRIDPETNTVVAAIGADVPCGPPAFFEDSVWIDACDTPALVRYDAATNALAERITTTEAMSPIVIDDELWAIGESGIYRLDPDARRMRKESPCCGAIDPPAVRRTELWTGQGDESLMVLDTPDLVRVARVPIGGATTMALGSRAGWILSAAGGSKLTEVDLQSYHVGETYEFGVGLADVAIVGDRVWVTDFDLSEIFVITPP
jgi:hypothetical protein